MLFHLKTQHKIRLSLFSVGVFLFLSLIPLALAEDPCDNNCDCRPNDKPNRCAKGGWCVSPDAIQIKTSIKKDKLQAKAKITYALRCPQAPVAGIGAVPYDHVTAHLEIVPKQDENKVFDYGLYRNPNDPRFWEDAAIRDMVTKARVIQDQMIYVLEEPFDLSRIKISDDEVVYLRIELNRVEIFTAGTFPIQQRTLVGVKRFGPIR